MYQALYRKYRPTCFDDVVGEEHITQILKNELKSGKIFHAYLFTGPRGTGKTSCAKILAKAVNCLNLHEGDACCTCDSCKAIENGDVLDITEIDAASNNGVENIRDLREQVSYTPTSSKYRVYIIDEVHMLTIGAFNALLKTLEEPPSHIVFILATTEVHKLPATILSRCQRFDFHRISNDAIVSRIKYIAEKEGFKIDQKAAELIATLSDGGMRDALSTLDLCAANSSDITEQDVMRVCSLAGSDYCLELAEFIKNSDTGAALEKTDELHKNAVDLQRLCSEMISHYRNLMVARTVKDTGNLIVKAPKVLDAIKNQAANYPIGSIINAINVFREALDRMTSANRRTEFEMAIVRLCTPSLDTSASALLDRIEKLERTVKYANLGENAVQKPQTDSKVEVEENKPLNEVGATEDIDEVPVSEAPTSKAETKICDTEVVFDAWNDVLDELGHSAPLLAASLVGSTAYVKGDLLLIDSANGQFFSLMRSDAIYGKQIKNAVMSIVGRSYRLGPYKRKEAPVTDPLQDIMNKLKKLEVPGSED